MYWPMTSALIELENVSQSRSTRSASAYRVTWKRGRASSVTCRRSGSPGTRPGPAPTSRRAGTVMNASTLCGVS